jgi:hypothetical protein
MAKILVLFELADSSFGFLLMKLCGDDCVPWCFAGLVVVRWWCFVDGLNAKGCRSFRRRQPFVLISYLIVAN